MHAKFLSRRLQIDVVIRRLEVDIEQVVVQIGNRRLLTTRSIIVMLAD